jgi:hypothetical protein
MSFIRREPEPAPVVENPYDLLLAGRFEVEESASDDYLSFKCVRCHGVPMTKLVYFSLHTEEFGDHCAGPGEVIRLLVPYCLACGDGEPADRGCIHRWEYRQGGIVSVNVQAA